MIPDRLADALVDRYRLERELGEGGMAIVYLAVDLKHNRQVALKVLRPELAAILGAERFLKEIEVTANLQHPNILPLYDSGEADSFLYYVMPYFEGDSLRDRLDREGQLSVEETIAVTTDVAAALDFAHARNVVHRDIKPENILFQSGQAIVSDFGIALAVRHAGGTRLTETGLSLGTPHYMSPEQATGDRELDARSDVYSLGATVYEMLVGEPPHVGNSVQAVIAKILTDTPAPVSRSRELVPPNVSAAVQRALARSPADRFPSAGAFAEALTNPAFTLATGAAAVSPVGARSARWNPLTIGLAGLSVVLAVLLVWALLRPDPTAPVSRQRVVLTAGGFPGWVAVGAGIAPDGSAIVFWDSRGGTERLWIKEREVLEATPLVTIAGNQPAPPGPFFSPDGGWVAYGDRGLKKVARTGGSPITLSDSAPAFEGGAWLDDGTIVFPSQANDRLYRVSSAGGATQRLPFDEEFDGLVGRVEPLPGGRGVLFATLSGVTLSTDVWILDLRSGEARTVAPGATKAWYAPTGHLIYARPDGSLFAVPFDLGALEVTGPSVSVLEGVRVAQGTPDLQLSRDGTLLYARGTATAQLGVAELVWIDRRGEVSPLDTAWAFGVVPNGGFSLSPDGTRLAVNVTDSARNRSDIYVKRLPAALPSRLTFEGTQNIRPTWTPDGESVTFVSNRGGEQDLWIKRADGSRQARLLLDRPRPVWEGLWSPNGEWLIYRTDDVAPGNGDILAIRPDGDTIPTELVATEAEETSPMLSPDGRWLAYSSAVSGRKEVYVRPFPNVEDGIWQVSTSGGIEPFWSRGGGELFYRDGSRQMVAAQVTTDPTFQLGARRELFDAGTYWFSDDHRSYAVTPDDQRFLMLRLRGQAADTTGGTLILVENWFREVARLVGR